MPDILDQSSETSQPPESSSDRLLNGSGPRNSKGWDGKLRVERTAVLANPEALSDPDYSDEDAPSVEQIDADEGCFNTSGAKVELTKMGRFVGGLRQRH